jgi:hypothetical protein
MSTALPTVMKTDLLLTLKNLTATLMSRSQPLTSAHLTAISKGVNRFAYHLEGPYCNIDVYRSPLILEYLTATLMSTDLPLTSKNHSATMTFTDLPYP